MTSYKCFRKIKQNKKATTFITQGSNIKTSHTWQSSERATRMYCNPAMLPYPDFRYYNLFNVSIYLSHTARGCQ